MLINTTLNNKVNIVQDFHQIIRTRSFTKPILKKYLEGELNQTKNQGTSPTCLDYHQSIQIIY